MTRHRTGLLRLSLAGALVLGAAGAAAQPVITPDVSQKATVGQTIGLTDVSISYHRPLVNGRPVWGSLVPYDKVWRAGANQNTTIAFSTPVKVEGQPLAAGTYGLHTIPGKDEWTVIFSKNATSWGSYFYDDKEDALRVKVKPTASEPHEALTYTVDDVKADSAVVALSWEKLRVPVKVSVDLHETVLGSIRGELRSDKGFSWDGFYSAAGYCAQENINLEEALKWADKSIDNEERFENLQVKSDILKKLHKDAEAEKVMARALPMANAQQRHGYARQLLNQGKTQEALKLYQENAQKNPDKWFVHAGLARGYVGMGDYDKAVVNMKAALAKAPEEFKPQIDGLIKRLEKKENINKG